MGKRSEFISEEHIEWIQEQPMFFVATAMSEGRINVSPKGMDTLRIVSPDRVCWLNLTGSGNETATHLLESPRMTLLFNAFTGKPKILRLYGQARCLHPRDEEYNKLIHLFPDLPGKRQVIDMKVDLVQVSCGFGVPLMDYQGQRTVLTDWAEKEGEEGIRKYWDAKNRISLDGHDTRIF